MNTIVNRASVNGVELPYLEAGIGTPVVFVHGAISDYRIWESQCSELANRYRCIALSQRYFGSEPWQDSGSNFTRATHTQDLIAFLIFLGIGQVHLVGTSYGAEIAATVAVERPDLVRSLCLNEPSLTSVVSNPHDLAVLAQERTLLGPAIEELKAGLTRRTLELFCDWVDNHTGAFAGFPAAIQSMVLENARTLGLQLMAAPSVLSSANLRQLKVPLTLTVGSMTRQFFQIPARIVHEGVERSRIVLIPNAYHCAPFEDTLSFNHAVVEHIEHSANHAV
jgi:pimeloyl-ACP methyl ester carboxylesterase